ncbi:protein kinase domain-containing protein [Actinomadura chokoriensis]|uniref:protein kinase domain-containing protein n=1 Tax=Actinomadura chokoriensis TaxID=454156 RepID=UPI0031F89028
MYPQRFGNYELLSELGEGGMGTVHLGRAPDGRIVALKTMNRLAFHSEDGHRRFERETAALRKVTDPHVAAFVDADLAGPAPYLVTEYVQGRPLDAVVSSGPLGRDGLRRLGLGLARALRALHAAGLIHRDVKPANIIMAGGEPVLIDLGIAHHVDKTRITTRRVGTWSYIAPELVENRKPTEAADVFSWGAVMAYAATGRPCFTADSEPAIINQILTVEPDLSGVPGWLRGIVGRSLAKDPDHRPSVRTLCEAMADRPHVELLRTAYLDARDAHEHARAEGIAFSLHAIAVAAGDTALAASSLLDQAHAARYSGRFDRAETLFEQARGACAAVRARQDEGWAWDGIGVCRHRRGEYASAGEAFAAALAIAEEVGDTVLRAWNLCNLGSLALRRGDDAEAAARYDAGVAASGEHPDIQIEALNGRARCALAQDEPEAAESLYRRAARAAKEIGDDRREGWAWYDLGESARGRKSFDAAREALENALHIATERGDRLMEGWTRCKLGGCLRDTGRRDEAKAMYEQARDVAGLLHDEKMSDYATTRLEALTSSS